MTNKPEIKGCLVRAIETLDHANDLIGQAYGESGQTGNGYECPHIKKALADLQAFVDALPDITITRGISSSDAHDTIRLTAEAIDGGWE